MELGQVIQQRSVLLLLAVALLQQDRRLAGLPQLPVYTEGDLEEALVNNLSMFFLELGKGFTYVGRQQKMVIGGADL